MSPVPSARLIEFKDLEKCVKGESLRITGIWKKYDEHTKIAVMRYESYEAEVDMTLISSIPTTGDIVQCLGEVLEEATFGMLRIHARIIRVVNTLDLELYERVIRFRNTATT